MKKNNIIISLNKIKEWLAKQGTEQIMKPIIKKTNGHIVAYKENDIYLICLNMIDVIRDTSIFFVLLIYLHVKYIVKL